MNPTDILAFVSPALRRTAEQHAHKIGAAPSLWLKIKLSQEGELWRFADSTVPQYNRRRGFYTEALRSERRLLNLAERIVVAIRIEQDACTTATGREAQS